MPDGFARIDFGLFCEAATPAGPKPQIDMTPAYDVPVPGM